MSEMNFSQRKRRALAAARTLGAEALLVMHLPDVRYLCGFTGSSAALAVLGGKARLFTDGRYREQAKSEVKGAAVSIEQGAPMPAALTWLVKAGATRCGFDAAHTSVASFEAMRAALPRGQRREFLLGSQGLIARLREIKDAEELEVMRRAALLGCSLFEGVLAEIASGMPEQEVAAWLEREARRGGAEAMSFETIVASGERSALPHGRATRARLPKRGFVTLDFGVVLEGYCSDMTRTVHLGRPDAEARGVYDSVLEAQSAAVAAVRAGAVLGDVDEAARAVLRRAGLDSHFIHSTGHGVGLEIHEGPRVAARQEGRLEAGMVVTVEPGVYLPGRFGVRIEDMVLVTRGGGEVLTPSTKALIEF